MAFPRAVTSVRCSFLSTILRLKQIADDPFSEVRSYDLTASSCCEMSGKSFTQYCFCDSFKPSPRCFIAALIWLLCSAVPSRPTRSVRLYQPSSCWRRRERSVARGAAQCAALRSRATRFGPRDHQLIDENAPCRCARRRTTFVGLTRR